jgi:hypothetical protein
VGKAHIKELQGEATAAGTLATARGRLQEGRKQQQTGSSRQQLAVQFLVKKSSCHTLTVKKPVVNSYVVILCFPKISFL